MAPQNKGSSSQSDVIFGDLTEEQFDTLSQDQQRQLNKVFAEGWSEIHGIQTQMSQDCQSILEGTYSS